MQESAANAAGERVVHVSGDGDDGSSGENLICSVMAKDRPLTTFGAGKRGSPEDIYSGHCVMREAGRTFFLEIAQVGVDVVFAAMKLKIEAALGVGKRSDVENRGFPFEAGAPDDSFETNIETASRIDEQLHHRPTIIAIAVDGVEQRGVAAEAVGVDRGGGVDGMACIEEYAGAMDGVVLGANVQRRSAGERCVCAVEMETASEFTGRTFQNGAKLVGMVEKQRFEKQIVECSAGVEEDAKTVRETRSARVTPTTAQTLTTQLPAAKTKK